MSQINYQAFTVEGNGLMRAIHAPVGVSLSSDISKIFNLAAPPFEVRSLWDTGATSTSISKRLANRMKLPAISKQKIICAGQPYMSNIYKVNLYLPNKVMFQDVAVTEFEDANDFDVLIGMDIIASGDFALTNANGITVCSFKFPAGPDHIDFVKEINHKKSASTAIKKFKRREKKKH